MTRHSPFSWILRCVLNRRAIVIGAVFAAFFVVATYGFRLHRQQESSATIRSLKGKTYFAHQVYWAHISEFDSPNVERRYDRKATWIDNLFPRVSIVDLSGTDIRDDDVPGLADLPWLEELNLSDTSVTGTFLTRWSGRSSLEELSLEDSDLSAKCLSMIPKSVRVLDLSGTAVENDDLHLLDLPNLVRLNLSRTGVTDVGIKRFCKSHPRKSLCGATK